MAMVKFVAALILSLLAISMLQTMVMAKHGHGGHHKGNNAHHSAQGASKEPRRCCNSCKTQYHKPCMFFCQKCCSKCFFFNLLTWHMRAGFATAAAAVS